MNFIKKLPFLFILSFSITSVWASDTDTTPLTDAEALAIDAKYYAQTYGVSEDEAMRRILIMHDSSEEIAKLKAEYGDRISGMYFDNGPDFGIKVNLIGDNTPQEKKITRKGKSNQGSNGKHLGQLKKLGISDVQIENAGKKIGQDLEAKVSFKGKAKNNRQNRLKKIEDGKQSLKAQIPTLELVADNEKTDGVTLYLKSDDGKAKQIAEKLLGVPVDIEIVPSGIVPTHTRGGSKLVNSAGVLQCMTGFVAKHSSGQMGVLTAGHCLIGWRGNPTPSLKYTDKDGSNYAVSTVGTPVFDSRGDIGFITANHTTYDGQFYADNTATPRTLSATQSRYGMKVANGTLTGAYICHLGQISLTDSTLIQSCGEVSSVAAQGSGNPNTGVSVGGNTYITVKNTKSGAGTTYNPSTDGVGTLRCVAGDSGGPWFAYTTGYGVQSGCGWVNKETQKQATVTVITSLDYANLVGATLVTK